MEQVAMRSYAPQVAGMESEIPAGLQHLLRLFVVAKKDHVNNSRPYRALTLPTGRDFPVVTAKDAYLQVGARLAVGAKNASHPPCWPNSSRGFQSYHRLYTP